MRKAISPRHRLMVTLRYFISGGDFRTLEETSRIAHNTLSQIIPEVAEAIWKILGPQYIVLPTSEEEWIEKSEEFLKLWDYYRGLAALDGKHVEIVAPPRSGTVFYNYKSYFSFVLMALCDAKHNFMFIDVGAAGASNDSGIYNRSKLNQMRENGLLNFPQIPQGDQLDINYHFLGDDCFAMAPTLFKPYPADSLEQYKRTFNYRHSRARRIVESAFGIMSQRFQVLFSPIKQQYHNAVSTVKAICVLHNFLNIHVGVDREHYEDGEELIVPTNPESVAHVPQNPDENEQRKRLAEFYMSPAGNIRRFNQDDRINRTSRREIEGRQGDGDD